MESEAHSRGLTRALFVASLLCGCASEPMSDEQSGLPISAEQSALNICLWEREQPGWHFLESPPAAADALRQAIVASGQRPLPESGEAEWWFVHDDGRYLRCTNALGQMFVEEGMFAVCGTSTHAFTLAGDAWTVKGGDVVLCMKKK